MDFRVQLIRENVRTMLKAKTKEDVELLYKFILNDLEDLKQMLEERLSE